MSKFSLSIFLQFLLVSFCHGLYLGIDTTSGLLVPIDVSTYFQLAAEDRPQSFGLWPNSVDEATGAHCTQEVDALYTAHDQRYRIDDWVYIEHDFQEFGGISIVMSIYDLQEFVSYAHRVGAWLQPNNCQSIWSVIQNHGIVPVLNQLGSQHRPTLSARENGFVVDFRCKPDDQSAYHPCSSTDLYNLLEAHPSPQFRVYKN